MAGCTPQADQAFGPGVSEACRGGLDFTLLFEQALFTLVPATIFLFAFPFRLVYLAKSEVRARASPIRTAKLVQGPPISSHQSRYVELIRLVGCRLCIYRPATGARCTMGP